MRPEVGTSQNSDGRVNGATLAAGRYRSPFDAIRAGSALDDTVGVTDDAEFGCGSLTLGLAEASVGIDISARVVGDERVVADQSVVVMRVVGRTERRRVVAVTRRTLRPSAESAMALAIITPAATATSAQIGRAHV